MLDEAVLIAHARRTLALLNAIYSHAQRAKAELPDAEWLDPE